MKVAGVQIDIAFGEVEQNRTRVCELMQKIADNHTQLAVFPECCLTGYCFASLEDALAVAETIPGPSVELLEKACRTLGLHIVLGMLERQRNEVFNSAVCIGPTGLLGVYRKVHLPELGVDHFVSPGNGPFEVLDLGFCRLGMLVCYDISFPEAARSLTLDGADLIALPTNWPPGAEPTAEHVINARSSENHIYVIAVNRIGREDQFDFIGHSRITDVYGRTLTHSKGRHEEILYASIDPALARQKKILRAPGHSVDRIGDRRPELYGRLTKP